MPSNFEMVVIALLIVNLIITLYCNYRIQENFGPYKPSQPSISFPFSTIGNFIITTPITTNVNDSPITKYEYSINDTNRPGTTYGPWKIITPIQNSTTTSNIATFTAAKTASVPVASDFTSRPDLPNRTIIVRVSNEFGTSSSSVPVKMDPFSAPGQKK
jgi:hypothetical protein